MIIVLTILALTSVYIFWVTLIFSTCDWWIRKFGIYGLVSNMWPALAFFTIILPVAICLGLYVGH